MAIKRAFHSNCDRVLKITVAFLFLILLGLPRLATAADTSVPLTAAEKDLLGVWIYKQGAQIAVYQIFSPDHSFVQVRQLGGMMPDGSPPLQTGKWSVNKNILSLDYDGTGRHTSPKFSITPGKPVTMQIIPDGARNNISFTYEKEDSPVEVTDQALVGDWNYQMGPAIWRLQQGNVYSFTFAGAGRQFTENGQWHLDGNQLTTTVARSDLPGDAGFSGSGKIVLLTTNWLLIDEQGINGKHFLDVFHHGEIGKVAQASPAARTKAIADIDGMTTALKLFEVVNSRFPTTDEGLQALITNPGNLQHWEKTLDTDKIPLDPWGHPYIYRCPGSNGNDFDLLSAGPDGQEGTADDVTVK